MALRFDEYCSYDALGLASLVQRGDIPPVELLEIAIGRADAVNPRLNAIVHRLDARAHARASAALPLNALFAGVPFLLKDLYQDLAGEPSSCGNRALARFRSTETADVTRRWEEAGLVVFGFTNTPEFGSLGVTEPQAFGPTRNPWDLSRTPGGSSGGAAAAVAAGIVPVAGASDGGGSIRIPAAACGLFGLKPGRGRISIGPAAAEALYGAGTQGVVSRSVRDTAAMLDVLQGPEPHAPYYMPSPERPYLESIKEPPRRLRIAWSTASPIGTPVHKQAVAAVHDAVQLLASLGHEVEEAAPAIDGQQLAADFLLPWFCHVAHSVEEARAKTGARLSDFDPETRAMAAVGRTVSALELVQTHHRWHDHTRALARFHDQYDLWLTPVLSEPAVKIGQLATPAWLARLNDIGNAIGLAGVMRKTSAFQEMVIQSLAWTPFTQVANLTGRPAMSVPLFWTPEGLPMGVQFVAPLNGEETLLRLAAELEQARPWFDKRPVLA